MTVYHIGKDGQVRTCSARDPSSCPLGGFHSSDEKKVWDEAERQAAAEQGIDTSYTRNMDVTSWSEPKDDELLIYGTPNRTYDSTASFFEKLRVYDHNLRALGAKPVANLEGKWQTEYERSLVYSIPKPKTKQDYERFREQLRHVVEKFNQDSILIVRQPFKGEKTNATNYCFDGVTQKNARRAAGFIASCRKAKSEGRSLNDDDIRELREKKEKELEQEIGNDEELWSFGSSYQDGRFSTFGFDKYQKSEESSDSEAFLLGHFFGCKPSRSRLVLDEVTPRGNQQERGMLDRQVREEAEDLGLVNNNKRAADIYKTESANTEEALEEWRNYGRQ